jgi:hypothetical protein
MQDDSLALVSESLHYQDRRTSSSSRPKLLYDDISQTRMKTKEETRKMVDSVYVGSPGKGSSHRTSISFQTRKIGAFDQR